MSQLKVNAIRGTGASSDAVTLASDGTCTAKITNNLSNRNLIINGSCIVAQRSTAAVTDDGFQTVDRFKLKYGGTDNHPTQERHALTSSDTGPWEKGFRYSYHITNGDQTGGADAGDWLGIKYIVEAQDIANSGWNYTSTSSYITFSFWVKSSVAQNFYGELRTEDGTRASYPFETGSLSANTWTKITKTIPGSSSPALQLDSNNGAGLNIMIFPFLGTSDTGTNAPVNTWKTYSGDRTPNNTTTWWTTNDATFEITGLQLEVGDVATDFEHRSYGDELARCQRYYEQLSSYGVATAYFGTGYNESTSQANQVILWKVEKRTTPGVTTNGDANFKNHHTGQSVALSNLSIQGITPLSCRGEAESSSAVLTDGGASVLASYNSNDAIIKIDAEL